MGPLTPEAREQVNTANAARQVSPVQSGFRRAWLDSLDVFDAEIDAIERGIDPVSRERLASEAEKGLARSRATGRLAQAWGDEVEGAVRRAHRGGLREWGPVTPRPEQAEASVASFASRQRRFATRFAVDVARGYTSLPGKMDVGQRIALYENALEGAFHLGAIDGSPDGYLVWWALGSCSHCDDCPVLAHNSPYTRETLPTFPRDGMTTCRANCCCSLDFRQADVPTVGPGDSLIDRTLTPTAPPGRRPTREEQVRLWDLESRQNFARRKAAITKGRERRRWLSERKAINAEINRIVEAGSLHHVPTFDVGEVVTGTAVRPGEVSSLTHLRGIDGSTIAKTQARAIRQATQAAADDLDDLLRSLAAEAVGRRAELPGVASAPVYHLGARGVAAQVALHLAAIRALRRYPDTELGPVDEDWVDLVLAAGTWIAGPVEQVDPLLAELSRAHDFVPAPYQERG